MPATQQHVTSVSAAAWNHRGNGIKPGRPNPTLSHKSCNAYCYSSSQLGCEASVKRLCDISDKDGENIKETHQESAEKAIFIKGKEEQDKTPNKKSSKSISH